MKSAGHSLSSRFATTRRLLAVFALALCVFLGAVVPALAVYSADAGTVILQHLEGATNGENHGSPSYMPSAPGLGQAVDLGVADWVKYPLAGWYQWPTAYNPAGKFGTFEMWIFPRAYSTGFFGLNWNNSNTPPGAGYIGGMGLDATGKLYVSSWQSIEGGPATGFPAGSTTIPLNAWTHVAYTWSPSGSALYVNGELECSDPDNHYPALNPTTYVYVNGWGTSDFGGVDELRISSVARSQSEILAHYQEHAASNQPPVAQAQSVTTSEDVTLGVTLTADDADGDTLSFAVVTGPARGALSGTAPTLTYTPDPNYSGTDAFTFKANDGVADSNVATISITVTPVNDAPTDIALSNDGIVENEPADSLVGFLSTVDPDAGDLFTYTLVSGPGDGDNDFFATDDGLLCTAAAFDYETKSQFSIRLRSTDLGGLFTEKVLIIDAYDVNDPPIAADDAYTVAQDGSLLVAKANGVLKNDSDPEDDSLVVGSSASPAHGTLALAADGSFTYTPDAGWYGIDTFTYRASDGGVLSEPATVSISVVRTIVVTFHDAGLETAVRSALGKPSGDITDVDMLSLTSLAATGLGIEDLAGIEYATNLTSLDLGDEWAGLVPGRNQIADITPLAGLTKLEYLDLYGNQVTTMTPVAGLTNLTRLGFAFNNVADITPVAGLAKLTWLDLSGNQIVDMTPVAGLTELTALYLEWNQITDITPVTGLTNLTALCLGDQIADISPIAGLSGLTVLSLEGDGITDLSAVAGLSELYALYLTGSQITTITPVAGLNSLTILSIDGTQLTDLAPVAGLSNLEFLFLDRNQITDITPLAGLTNLTDLYLNENQITDISPVASLTGLTMLSLNYSQIVNIAPVASLGELTDLSLIGNQITNITPLSGLTKLEYLYIFDNCLDLTPGSPARVTISALQAGGTSVEFEPQKEPHTITPTAGPHGSIAPNTAQTVAYGASRTFTITPEAHYRIADVLVDGHSVGASSTVTFTNVTTNHTISASFAADTVPSAIVLSSGSSASLGYGSAFAIRGTLSGGGGGLAGRSVVLQAAAPGGSFSDTAYRVTTGAGGAFSFSVTPSAKTYYRVRFAGATGYAASESASVYATPKPSVGTPKAPSKMSHSKSHIVYGYLKPRHTSGTYPVRIYKYRKVSGKWKSYGYVKAKASNYSSYTKYSVKVRLSKAGKWRLRAYAPADSGHAAAWSSGYDYVTVK